MTAGDEGRAEYYRQIADEIIRVAEKTQDAAIRRELLYLAERFRRLAEHVERRAKNSGAPAS